MGTWCMADVRSRTPSCSLGAQVSLFLVLRSWTTKRLNLVLRVCPCPNMYATCVLVPRCLSLQVKNKPWCFSAVWVEHSFQSSSVKVIGIGKNLLLSDWCQRELIPFPFSLPLGHFQRLCKQLCLSLPVMLWLIPYLWSRYECSIHNRKSQWSLQEAAVKWCPRGWQCCAVRAVELCSPLLRWQRAVPLRRENTVLRLFNPIKKVIIGTNVSPCF